MHNIQNYEQDELTLPLNGSPGNLKPAWATAVAAVIIMFFIMMVIPAHLAVAMLFIAFIAICRQIGLMFNNTNKQVKELEMQLLISRAGKQRIQMDETN